MKKIFSITILIVLAYLPVSYGKPASIVNNFISGDKLLLWCKNYIDGKNTSAASYCVAYVDGAVDVYNSSLASTVGQASIDCYQKNYPGITGDQLVRLIYKYLNEYPISLNYGGGAIVRRVMEINFPYPEKCKNLK